MLPAAFVFVLGVNLYLEGEPLRARQGSSHVLGVAAWQGPAGGTMRASSPTYYFTGYGRRQLLHHPLQQNTAAGAAEPEQPCHEQVLFPAGVDTPQHSQADTCAGAQPRKKLPKVIAPPIYS